MDLLTSESKRPGQIAVVYHYCDLSRFFDSDVTNYPFFVHFTKRTDLPLFVHVVIKFPIRQTFQTNFKSLNSTPLHSPSNLKKKPILIKLQIMYLLGYSVSYSFQVQIHLSPRLMGSYGLQGSHFKLRFDS